MTIMEGIKDKRTATQAGPKLERVYKRIKDLNERAEKLDPPHVETMQKIAKMRVEHMKKQMDRGMRLAQQAPKDPEVEKILRDIVKKIQDANQ